MHPSGRIPPNGSGTGVERLSVLVARERIIREARYLAVRATMKDNAPLPVPLRDVAIAKDLRRGRLHPLGRVMWFFQLLKDRRHPEARAIAERIRDLISEAIDAEFPLTASETARLESATRTSMKLMEGGR